jgi:hypothetical protein
MQTELGALPAPTPILILGVNEAGQESGNPAMCNGRTIPWLQDTPEVNVWHARWNPTFRDVVILDRENLRIAAFNLTEHDLNLPANYDLLKTLLIEAAGAPSL